MCCSPRFLDVNEFTHILNLYIFNNRNIMSKSLDEIVKDINDLVSLPGVFVRVNEMVNDPQCSMTKVAEVISQDPGLTMRILRMANSPAYGISQEIDSVAKAVTIIGTQKVRDIALATSAVETFDGIPNDLVSMDDFWMHSIYCAIIAKYLASKTKVKNPDGLFVAGLLHDIGQLVLFKEFPELSRKSLEYVLDDTEDTELYIAEQEFIGFDHAMVGSALAKNWHLTPMLIEVIGAHHDISKATSYQQESAVVKIANSLAVMTELNTTDIEETDAAILTDQDWAIAGLHPDIIEAAIEYAHTTYKEVQNLLLTKH